MLPRVLWICRLRPFRGHGERRSGCIRVIGGEGYSTLNGGEREQGDVQLSI